MRVLLAVRIIDCGSVLLPKHLKLKKRMIRSVAIGAAALGTLVVAVTIYSEPKPTPPSPGDHAGERIEKIAPPSRPQRLASAVEDRIVDLETRLARETALREELEGKLRSLADQVTALGRATEPATSSPADGNEPHTTDTDKATHAPRDAIDYSASAMERALTAAGLAPQEAEAIKRRQDELAMTEMYLRDQAVREQWIDTPRFSEEMASLAEERTSIRDEIGDDAFDQYLFRLGRPNRVRVDDVLLDSLAEQVDLRTGDMILHYGETRLFAPEDLVRQTQTGTAGEPIVLDVVRNGERISIEVPRGPLGLRINATQDDPARPLR